MAKIAVILSGCGFLDGAEIREAVLTLLYLDEQGADVSLFAPDKPQHDVINHIQQSPEEGEPRNVLTEAARIARGHIEDVSKLNPDAFDALVIPGGFGAAKNLCDFAIKGADCKVDAQVQRVIQGFFDAQKPIGAMCIAPALLAAALAGKNLTLTIGDDADTAAAIESLGHHHVACASDEAAIDKANKIATCSAYMREDKLSAIARGIEQVVTAVIRMINHQQISKAS